MQQSMTSFSISFVFKGREFRLCDWINFLSESAIDWKKKIVSLSPKVIAKKQPKYKYSSMESQQPYWVLSVPYFSEQTREFYIFTWQTSVFV